MLKIQPKTLFIGKNSIYLPSCHSTNDITAEMIQTADVFDGTIVITSNQTAGRGQRGNGWEAQPGQNITLSLVLKPNFLSANEQFRLNIAISLGIQDFLRKYLPESLEEELKIKWPNDLYFGDRKMGGVLIENTLSGSRIGYSIVGIGLNINQLEFSEDKPISLRAITWQEEYDLEKLIETLCESLEKYYLTLKNGQISQQKELYLRNLYRYQETHEYRRGITQFLGQIIGIDEVGRLALAIDNEIVYFDFKEIEFVV